MKTKALFLGLSFFMLAAVAFAKKEKTKKAEDFTIYSVPDNAKFTLSENKGKIVVLHFLLKTECPFCLKYTHEYSIIAEKDPSVVHVFMKPDSKEDIQAWLNDFDKSELQSLPKIYQDADAKLADRFGVPGGFQFHGQVVHYPATIILNKRGKEVFRFVGKDNSDRLPVAEFNKQIEKLKTEKHGKDKK